MDKTPNSNTNINDQIRAMNDAMDQAVREFNELQHELTTTLNAVLQRCTVLDLIPMWTHNARAPASGTIRYPPGIARTAPLPVTIADAVRLDGAQAGAALAALEAANAPNLRPLAPDAGDAEKKQHLLEYLGIYI